MAHISTAYVQKGNDVTGCKEVDAKCVNSEKDVYSHVESYEEEVIDIVDIL